MEENKAMQVNIYSFSNSLESFDDISIIRIKSKEYTLLIMPDYMPTIGQLEGSLSIVGPNIDKTWENIMGYYVIRKNTFELIVKDTYKHA